MKRLPEKKKKVAKGMPSAVLLSILIHAVLFFLAGMLVVFTVVKKEEQRFVPPKAVERPKMKLKKPKVKIKKTSQPKPTQRIVTKMNRASMPDIQLPEMSGMGEGLGDGIDGFDMMPDLGEVSVFGSGQTIGNDFMGTFYDLKRDRSGRNIPHDIDSFQNIIRDFLRSGWSVSKLARFYQSPEKLYTTSFAFPTDQSIVAPSAFGVNTIGWLWVVHYKGQLVYPEDIRFRFWGTGDDILAVRVDGELVLLAVSLEYRSPWEILWKPTSPDTSKYIIGNRKATVGDWIELKAGEPLDMEVLAGEIPGGNFCAMLCVEVEGVEYPKNPFMHGPTLPIFKTEELSSDLVEAIHNLLDPYDACVTNGPVFRDYIVKQVSRSGKLSPAGPIDEPEPEVDEKDGIRTWETTGGESFEANYVLVVGSNVVLKNGKGKQFRIPCEQLSDEDRDYLGLKRPPEFDVDFIKTSRQVMPPERAPGSAYRDLRTYMYRFGTRLKQRSAGEYNHKLEVEYFAVGEEVDGDNYILLERNKSVFVPADTREFEFHSKKEVKVQSKQMTPDARMRGNKFGGYLITITDKSGKIIQHQTSNKFLYENINNLKKLPVGKHFDRSCRHVGPPRPDERDRAEYWYTK